MRYAVESYVEPYVQSSGKPRCKRRFEYVKVVPLSRYSTVQRALLRDDQVVMQPTMITFPSLPSFLLPLLIRLSLASSALSKLSFFFLITIDLNRHFGATSASLRIEDSASTQPLCSQAIHRCLPGTLQREGRWASGAYKAFVRSHGKDASRVVNVIVQEGMGNGIQPGQGKDWGQVNPIPKHEGYKSTYLLQQVRNLIIVPSGRKDKLYQLVRNLIIVPSGRKDKLYLDVRILMVQQRG